MMNKLSKFAAVKRALLLIGQAAPMEISILLPLNFLYGAGPILHLYISKIVIDEAARLIGSNIRTIADLAGMHLLLGAMLAFPVAVSLLDAIITLRGLAIDSLRERVVGESRRQLLTKVAGLDDLSLFENPEALNTLKLAEGGTEHLWQLATGIGRLMVGVFAFVPALVLTLGISWWVPLLLSLSVLPAVVLQGRIEDQSWAVEQSQVSNARSKDLIERMILNETYAKEARLYSLHDVLLMRWQSYFHKIFQAKHAVRTKGAWIVICTSAISAIGAFVSYVYVILQVIQGRFSLGDLALFAGLIFQVRRSLEFMVYEGAEVYQSALAIGPVFQVLDYSPQLASNLPSSPRTNPLTGGICFNNVTFTYPGTDKPALDGVDLAINPGEVLLLVGENGAGKTTLTKLMSRLYDPDAGEITWGGTNLKGVDIKELRERIAVVVQDYARFPVTARDNIGFGDLAKLHDDSTLLLAAQEVGLDIAELPLGLDTPLSKMLDQGTDLSVGQWQKVAIARALLRQTKAELVLLDEPTAAIDPQSEHKILEILREFVGGKMAIVVSHRLSLARVAHRIAVLSGGRIVEQGTHAELMALGGRYCDMFTRQASSYKEPNTPLT
jgi:ATP-binding cassette subfamily B protein